MNGPSHLLRVCLISCCVSGAAGYRCAGAAAEAPDGDPLAAWRDQVVIRAISAVPARHTIHSYYLTCPESPDGTRVLFFASPAADGQRGDLVIRDRRTGEERTVARNLETEDAHRAACQQWTGGGRQVAFHDVRDGRWGVYVVDAASGDERLVAADRQLAFGQPAGKLLPLYGCHWNPGPHRDLELADAETGAIRTVVEMERVAQAYGPWLREQFGDRPVAIFFPVVSPNEQRVFFKLACGTGGDTFRSKSASQRQGLIAYDLAERRFLFFNPRWGHPAWHPDSRRILEVGNLFLDAEDNGRLLRIPDLPKLRGCHPAVSPDGRLFVMDGLLEPPDGKPGEYGIMVCDIRGGAGRSQLLHRFPNTRGARSWRRNDPHPVFSPDGRRIYFNVNETNWTQLYVAEARGAAGG